MENWKDILGTIKTVVYRGWWGRVEQKEIEGRLLLTLNF